MFSGKSPSRYYPAPHSIAKITRLPLMNTRYATSDDISELVRVINLAYRVEDFFIDGDRTNTKDVQSRLVAAGACFIVVDAPDRKSLAGAVWVETNADRGHFAVLSVDPAFQGQGLARLMIDAVEDHCRKAGCTSLDIEVVDLRDELPAFYAKFGFEPAGTAPFPSNEKLTRPAQLMLMTKSLSTSDATTRNTAIEAVRTRHE
jgi:ribosomal protein S18 acetylase RimI-like enzyme